MTDQNLPSEPAQKRHLAIVEVIRKTAPASIAELDFVRDKYIQNYNFTHKSKVGEMMYHRQLIHFKQLIAESDKLKACDPFSLYACFLTAAVNGDSLDPNDEETYLIPLAGKARLWPQVKSRVKRLRNSGQVRFLDQAKLVYKGDEFVVEGGRVVRHAEKFESEEIIAGYVRFVLDDAGTDKYFIYRKSDWQAWRAKSPQAGGENWNTNNQPLPSFLRTKLIKHACNDKSWSSARFSNSQAEIYNVEIDDPEEESNLPLGQQEVNAEDVTGKPQSGAEESYGPAASNDVQSVVINHSNDEDY